MEQGRGDHIRERGNKRGRRQRRERIHIQNKRFPGPVDHGGRQHSQQDRRPNALHAQQDNHEQAHKHGDHGQNHIGVFRAHGVAQDAGGHRAEEVPHDIEGGGIAVALRVNSGVGAEADIHQHQADCRSNAKAHAQRDRADNLFPHAEDGQRDKHKALYQNNAQRRLKRAGVLRIEHSGDIAGDHGEETV